MKKRRVYVVPHSHWDREWYFTIEDSNVLLVENLDYLIDFLENHPSFPSYVFDGQSSVIEEYLKLRPEQKDRLKKLIQEKRLFIGPWYTQTDSLLVHKESIIRNLLYGTRIANDMGHSMKIGYLPDIFGQNAYLPSIFRGFDIEYSILQRGLSNDQMKGDVNFLWQSPDGQRVKANYLYFGYGPGKFLSADETYYKTRLLPMLTKLKQLNTHTDHLLLPAGGDQVLVRTHFPKTIETLNEKDPVHDYILSDYETFMEETWTDKANFENVVEGELIASQKARIHHTIRSQRYDIKKLNYTVEHQLLHILEPLATIGQSLGLTYPKAWLDTMWKNLFDAHAHDSIGGCNSDETNMEVIHRLKKIHRIADGLINIFKKQLTYAISKQLGKDNLFIVFHTSPKNGHRTVQGIVFTKTPSFSIQHQQKECVFDIVDQQYIRGGKRIIVTAEGEKEEEMPGYYRTVVLLTDIPLPPLGYTTLEVVEGDSPPNSVEITSTTYIENEFYQIRFQNGQVHLTNRQTGRKIHSFLQFENTGDAGDSYDYSPLPDEDPLLFQKGELICVEKGNVFEKMVIRHSFLLPANLEERRQKIYSKPIEIITRLELRKGEEILRMTHELENEVEDHRIRVRLKTPVKRPKTSFADQGFTIIDHPVDNPYLANWREQHFAERPSPIYPLENMAGVCNEEYTFTVFTKGIKEYEVIKDTGEMTLTLFRSVGLLGRDNLLWRPGRASGINNKVVYTPDAQMKQQMVFEYSIYFGDGHLNPGKLFSLIDLYRDHYTSYQKQMLNTFEERLERFEIPFRIQRAPHTYSLLEIEADDIFMSVLKQAYEDDATIIRLFNPTAETKKVNIRSKKYKEIIEVNLYEREICPINGPFEIHGKGYKTFKLKP